MALDRNDVLQQVDAVSLLHCLADGPQAAKLVELASRADEDPFHGGDPLGGDDPGEDSELQAMLYGVGGMDDEELDAGQDEDGGEDEDDEEEDAEMQAMLYGGVGLDELDEEDEEGGEGEEDEEEDGLAGLEVAVDPVY